MVQNRVQQQVLVNTIMNLKGSVKGRNCLGQQRDYQFPKDSTQWSQLVNIKMFLYLLTL
jgi:hypothetical protein